MRKAAFALASAMCWVRGGVAAQQTADADAVAPEVASTGALDEPVANRS